jgi:hypothetical protein
VLTSSRSRAGRPFRDLLISTIWRLCIASRPTTRVPYHPSVTSAISQNITTTMSAAPSAKRQRTSTIGAGAPAGPNSIIEITALIDRLPEPAVRNLLINAALRHADIASTVQDLHNRAIVALRNRAIDFDHYSKSAWKALNVTYARLSGSNQYEIAGEAMSQITDCIEAINKATPEHASFGTKKSALETLRKIGKSIALGNADVLGHEVQKQFQWDHSLETTMLRIAESMSVEERNKFMTAEFEDKLLELERLGDDHCIFESLKDVRLALLGADPSSGEDEPTGFEEGDEGFSDEEDSGEDHGHGEGELDDEEDEDDSG